MHIKPNNIVHDAQQWKYRQFLHRITSSHKCLGFWKHRSFDMTSDSLRSIGVLRPTQKVKKLYNTTKSSLYLIEVETEHKTQKITNLLKSQRRQYGFCFKFRKRQTHLFLNFCKKLKVKFYLARLAKTRPSKIAKVTVPQQIETVYFQFHEKSRTSAVSMLAKKTLKVNNTSFSAINLSLVFWAHFWHFITNLPSGSINFLKNFSYFNNCAFKLLHQLTRFNSTILAKSQSSLPPITNEKFFVYDFIKKLRDQLLDLLKSDLTNKPILSQQEKSICFFNGFARVFSFFGNYATTMHWFFHFQNVLLEALVSQDDYISNILTSELPVNNRFYQVSKLQRNSQSHSNTSKFTFYTTSSDQKSKRIDLDSADFLDSWMLPAKSYLTLQIDFTAYVFSNNCHFRNLPFCAIISTLFSIQFLSLTNWEKTFRKNAFLLTC